MVRILPVQGDAGRRRVVQRRRLLDGVVAVAEGDELRPVGDGDVQAVGLGLVAEFLALEVYDGSDGLLESVSHFRDGVLLFP